MEPGDRPAYWMSEDASVTLPIFTVMEFVRVDCPVAKLPGATAGFVAPKPVPKRETISPGFAGDAPVTTLGLATTVKVCASSAAMLMELGNRKKAGEKLWRVVTFATAL